MDEPVVEPSASICTAAITFDAEFPRSDNLNLRCSYPILVSTSAGAL